MHESELEFLKALQSMEIKEPEPLEFRLHYNEHGDIIACSMQAHPENTNYVVVTREEYDRYFNYHVVKGQLKLIDKSTGHRVHLIKSDCGFRTVRSHAGILLEPHETYDEVEYYDTTN